MKKYIYILTALLAFATAWSCKPDEQKEEPFTLTLSQSNVTAPGLAYDYAVSVNNASKAIEIIADYLDKDELNALKVDFVGIPQDVTVNYNATFNYSNGATQKVTFSKGKQTIEYTLSASCSAPDPHFIGITVASLDAISGTIKVSGRTDLTKLPVTFTVSPADTKVSVNGSPIASGDEVDFSDKVNGVTFSLTCANVTKEFNVKVQTTGASGVSRIWGKYTSPVSVDNDGWFGSKVTGELNALRNIAMDDKYIYISRSEKDDNRGVYAISITDPEDATFMSQEGIETHGVHHTSCVATMDNGSSSVILLCNLVNAKDQHLYVYKYESVTSKPSIALDYVLPEAIRLGDKMMAEGDWKDGKLWFHDYTSGKKSYVFTVKDGKINATPTVIDYTDKMGNIGSMYKLPDGNYIWAGAGASATVFSVSGTTATKVMSTTTAYFGIPLHGAAVFTYNEEMYFGYVVLRNSYQDGQFRLTALPAATIAESLENPGGNYIFGLGDPKEQEITALKNGNGLGSGVYRVIDGHAYYAAYVPGAGISLFEIK